MVTCLRCKTIAFQWKNIERRKISTKVRYTATKRQASMENDHEKVSSRWMCVSDKAAPATASYKSFVSRRRSHSPRSYIAYPVARADLRSRRLGQGRRSSVEALGPDFSVLRFIRRSTGGECGSFSAWQNLVKKKEKTENRKTHFEIETQTGNPKESKHYKRENAVANVENSRWTVARRSILVVVFGSELSCNNKSLE